MLMMTIFIFGTLIYVGTMCLKTIEDPRSFSNLAFFVCLLGLVVLAENGVMQTKVF